MDQPWSVTAVWEFRDAEYEVSASKSGESLTVQVEEMHTADQWRGQFEAKHIEELTRKTGNFKQFAVFYNMLQSAITKSSASVTLDLLTYTDLEMLRNKKLGSTGISPGKNTSQLQTKRYLILTYSAEFDRIHYPLALSYVGKPDPAALKETIRRLQQELTTNVKQAGHGGQKQSAFVQLKQDYDALLQEKRELEEDFERLQQEAKPMKEGNQTKELAILKKVIKNLEEDLLKERSKHQKQISKANQETRALLDEVILNCCCEGICTTPIQVEELRSSERTLQARVKSLTNELAVLRQSWRSTSVKSSSGRTAAGTIAHARQRSSSTERRTAAAIRSRTPSPSGFKGTRFDPTAYVHNKQNKQQETKRLNCARTRVGTRSRSNSAEGRGLPPFRSTPVVSVSVNGSGSSRASSRRSSIDSDRSRTRRSVSKRSSQGSTGGRKRKSSLHAWESPSAVLQSKLPPKHAADGGLLDQSAEMVDIDARLKALQQFMKHSLNATKGQATNR
ncbi:hypothetical protein EMCRGX_G032121 [Ephydatia muelleri]